MTLALNKPTPEESANPSAPADAIRDMVAVFQAMSARHHSSLSHHTDDEEGVVEAERYDEKAFDNAVEAQTLLAITMATLSHLFHLPLPVDTEHLAVRCQHTACGCECPEQYGCPNCGLCLCWRSMCCPSQ
ncbi:hypothetical protein G3I60_05015 [Streptomyces sp. SID13666]|uniref:hypothetical protein n=1 Tax=Streptomyces sp. SID13666 TaxID=2706054 RepID=UPI0013C1B463|nr:hypothetical protein [Streptomyces sp. SID13666]NEA53530.1 hypothetical protein [Streptomyces sp. SID13666]